MMHPMLLPEPSALHQALVRARRQITPRKTQLREAPADSERESRADATAGEAAMYKALAAFLGLGPDTKPLRLHARPADLYATEALVLEGDEATHAVVSLPRRWEIEVKAGRVGPVGDAFIVETLEADAQGRPVQAVGLPRLTEGQQRLSQRRFTVAWGADGVASIDWSPDGPGSPP